MTAASFWSLLAPALEMAAHDWHRFAFLPVAVGFLLGGVFVYGADFLSPYFGIAPGTDVVDLLVSGGSEQKFKTESPINNNNNNFEGTKESTPISMQAPVRQRKQKFPRKSSCEILSLSNGDDSPQSSRRGSSSLGNKSNLALSWKRIFLLIFAIVIHNIPEGLVVGVSFGAAGKSPSATFESAWTLTLGIGIQNFPEGLAVSLPLAGFGLGKFKCFFWGQLSGIVEVFAAIAGAYFVQLVESALPYALGFAAGAMIYVVVDDLIAEAQRFGNGRLASWSAMLGFVVMMSLDCGLG